MQLMNGINVWLTGIFAVMGRTTLSGALVGLSITYAIQVNISYHHATPTSIHVDVISHYVYTPIQYTVILYF